MSTESNQDMYVLVFRNKDGDGRIKTFPIFDEVFIELGKEEYWHTEWYLYLMNDHVSLVASYKHPPSTASKITAFAILIVALFLILATILIIIKN